MAGEAPFFRPGGTMDPFAPSYIERAADRDLLAALLAREYVFLLDSRQKGKSSLVARTIVKLRENDVVPVRIDLQRIGANLTPEQWYAGMLNSVSQDLGLTKEAFEYWERLSAVGPLSRWMAALKDVVLKQVQQPIVIFIDEVDFVRALPFSADEFFAGIRDCYNRRADDLDYSRLTFCLVGVATPGKLIRNAEITPFNIGKRIELQDFNPEEQSAYAVPLAGGGRNGAALLERIGYWVNGHPYLTQLLCSRVLENPAIVGAAQVDELVRREFLTPEALQREPNLSDVERRLLDPDGGSSERRAQVLEHFRKLLSGKRLNVPEENPVGAALRLSGIAVEKGGLIQIRNRLYASVFSEAWRRNALPNAERRRQRAAYRRGVLGTALVSTAVLSVIGTLFVQNLRLSSDRARALADSRANASRAEREAYDRTMGLIDKEAAEGKWMSVRHLVDGSRESPLRGWEWSFWNAMVNDCIAEYKLDGRISAVYPQENGDWIIGTDRSGLFRLHNNALEVIDDTPIRYWPTADPNLMIAQDIERTKFFVVDALTGRERYQIDSAKCLPNRSSPWVMMSGPKGMKLARVTPDEVLIDDESVLPSSIVSGFVSPSGRFSIGYESPQSLFLMDRASNQTRPIRDSKDLNSVSEVAFLEKERFALIASGRPALLVVDTASAEIVRQIKVQYTPAYAVQADSTGKSFFVAFANGTASEVEWPSGRVLNTYRAHLDGLSTIVPSLDGRLVLTGGIDGSIRIWRRSTTPPVWDLREHKSQINMARLNADASRLITTSDDGTCKVFDARQRTLLLQIEIGSTPPPGFLLMDDEHDRALVGGSEGRVWLIELSSARVLWSSRAVSGNVCSGTLDGRFERAAVGDWLGNIAVVDLQTGAVADRAHVIDGKIAALAISLDDETLAIGAEKGLFKSPLSHLSPKLVDAEGRPENGVRSLCFSRTRDELLIGRILMPAAMSSSMDSTLREFKGHTHRVFRAIYSPSEKLVATISYDGTAKLWDARTGKLLHSLRHESWVSTLEFSPDESRVLTSSADRTVRIWRVDSGEQVSMLQNGAAEMGCASFSADGTTVVTGSFDGSVRVYFTKKL